MASKVLYWGNNDAHEFWESEDHELLILRCHHESWWSAHRSQRFLFATSSAEGAAKRLKAVLSSEKVWKQAGRNRSCSLFARKDK